MNLYPATAFIRHLLGARSAAGHGVHSPFVFDFLTKVVRGESDALIIREVESLRREMLADRRIVKVTDLGAGSAVHKGEERTISEIASTAALPARYAMLLSRIAGSIAGAQPDQRSLASTRADRPISNTRKFVKDEGKEDVGGEANLSGIKEEKDPVSIQENGNSGGRELVESYAGGQQQEEWSRELVESYAGEQQQEEWSRELVESYAGGQQQEEWSKEQGEWTQEQDTSSQKPGPDGPGVILELGSSLGISTLALALAAPERRVVTVEGCPALAEIARENLRRHGAANAEVLNMEFNAALSLLRREGTSVSMAFIDGNHRGDALKQYVSEISTMGNDMIIVADDIHLNRDMYNTWRFLVNHVFAAPASSKVPSRAERLKLAYSGTAPATMETFRFGILFCLRSLTPRHYRIRC